MNPGAVGINGFIRFEQCFGLKFQMGKLTFEVIEFERKYEKPDESGFFLTITTKIIGLSQSIY